MLVRLRPNPGGAFVELIPIAGRACQGCTACCAFPPIRDPALDKPANTTCPHCAQGAGCSVYARRPGSCRGWYCGWFFLPGLPEAWHPLQSGVVIRPEGFADGEITLLVLRKSAFLLSEGFAGMIGAWIGQGARVSFERLGPPGHLPAKMALDDLLAPALAARDLREMHKVFSWAIAYLDTEHAWEPDGIVLRTTLG